MQHGPIPELLRRASVILAQEVGRTPAKILDGVLPDLAQRLGVIGGAPQTALPANPLAALGGPGTPLCPVTGANSGVGGGPGDLQKQAHELLAALLSVWNPGKGGSAIPFYAPGQPGQRCPFTGAELPMFAGAGSPGGGLPGGGLPGGGLPGGEFPTFPGARDQLRRKAHELIETLLITFNEATGEKGLPAENQVPLVGFSAPVAPGDTARATLTVANEESSPCELSLYSSNFVADHGHDLPSLRVTILPRVAVVPAGGQMSFEVSIAVPQQTLKGNYCGLIQAQGSRYFKAVLSLDVL